MESGGFIDRTGKQLTPFKYGEEITDLRKSGYVLVRNKRVFGTGYREYVRLEPTKRFMRM